MDPITHALFGACMGRAGLNRNTALATATLAFAAEFPDIDILWSWTSATAAYAHHRGITHTILGAPFVAACSWGIVYVAYQQYEKRRVAKLDPEAEERKRLEREALPEQIRPPAPLPVDWKMLYGYALLASLAHILLDFTTGYGVRPFEPFTWRWFSWDIVAIIEPWLLGALVLALVLPQFFHLISSEVGARKKRFRGTGFAVAGLAFYALFLWYADLQHRKAVAILNNEGFAGGVTLRADAFPVMLNPWRWHGVVETENAIVAVTVDTRAGALDEKISPVVRYKPEESAATDAAKASPLGQVYLDWARFPFTETQRVYSQGGGWAVRIYDIRYRQIGNRSPGLTVLIRLDDKLNVVEQRALRPGDEQEMY